MRSPTTNPIRASEPSMVSVKWRLAHTLPPMISVLISSLQTPQRVPPEVWLRIFDLATDIESLLNCDTLASSDLPRMLVKQRELKRLKDSLHTKRSMALVCRTWNELALGFLYQSILISKVDTLISLHESLQRHALTTQGKNHLGWWTKRMDVLIEDERCEASDCNMLASVVRQLPNLLIVRLSMPMLPLNNCWLGQLPTSVVISLAETCGPSLQVFDCSESILRPCRQAYSLSMVTIGTYDFTSEKT